MKDYYKILGVSKDADAKTIKDAFRNLARKYHPDVNKDPEAEEKFKEINDAYSILSNPEKRKAFDYGEVNANGDVFQNPFKDFIHDFHFNTHRIVNPNTDIEGTLICDPSESFKEQHQKIEYQKTKFCQDCDGKGGQNGQVQCPDCQGRTFKTVQYASAIINTPCDRCKQRGFIFNKICDTCHGFGLQTENISYDVTIPVGAFFKKLRIAGGGNHNNPNYASGDLLITILPPSQYKDFYFTPNRAICLDLLIDPVEALIGVEKEVIDIKGEKVKVQIPAKSREKSIIDVAGHGLMINETNRGSLKIVIKYDYNQEMSETQKNILKQYINTKEQEVVK